MRILICIDDTDQKGGPGTGHLAQDICDDIEKRGWGTCSAISRHQLFVHPDIPYTSHNSSLCFASSIGKGRLDDVIRLGGDFLAARSAPGSDPGLCVAVEEGKLARNRLIQFGRNAKQTVLTKGDAYGLAKELGIHLSEHGGTGQGVVGALAGIGLRLSGNDGRFRGWYHLGREGESMLVRDLRSYAFIDKVKSEEGGEVLEDDAVVYFEDDQQKTVLQDSVQVLLVKKALTRSGSFQWAALTKQQVKKF